MSGRDHPRLCGEKSILYDAIDTMRGSPPPMRGKACTRRVTIPSGRITPAYAGKSASPPQKGQGFRDHPRLCGEKICRAAPLSGLPGSPPPMRGKDFFTCGELIPFGITPAYAGKSIYGKRYSGNIWDHPRLCGEKHYKKHR